MDGLIILIILIPLVFLILLISIYSRTGEQQRLLESLYDKIKQLSNEVSGLTKELKQGKETVVSKPILKEEPVKPVVPEIIGPKEVIPIEEELKKRPEPEPVLVQPSQQKPLPTFTPEKESWQPKNNDWEKFIGENLANKIGITVLVLGIAFFVKYAIDKNWINETGRVIVGLVCGGILIGLAHYFRSSYRSFSSVLVGGGLSVFYFSIAFAFHQYHLIGQTAAFTLMVVISALGVVLSIFYDRQELAILATIGGFITPFLVSTGQENYTALFTYLCILNTGLMVLAWFKKWPAINFIALFFTSIIYGGWLVKRTIFEDASTLPYKDALLFASLFYILFVAMNIINTLRLKNKFNSFDFIVVLSTNFLYYTAGMIILSYWDNSAFQGLFTLLIGIVNLVLAAVFYRNKTVDRNFVSLLIGLALTFISLAAPVELNGNHVVLFWAAEMLVLYWLYLRSKINLLRSASFIIAVLMLISLVLTWTDVYFSYDNNLAIIINKGFITTIVSAVALFIYYRLLKNEVAPIDWNNAVSFPVKRTVLITAITVAYLSGILEIFYQFSTRYTETPLHVIYLQAYSFAIVILLLQIFRNDTSHFALKLFFTTACFAFYLFGLTSTYDVSLALLTENSGLIFIAHWMAAAMLLWLLYDLIVFFFQQKNEQWNSYRSAFTWIASAGIILLLSVEMYHVIFWTNYRNEVDWVWWKNLYYKAGLTMLWGLCSFAMMWRGMKKDYKPLRIISLTLFTVTLLKLFLFDIRNIPPGGKIVAFILLGVLLLAVSFMYQRLRKIILDNKTD